MRLLLLAALLLTAPAWAQVTFTATPGSGYLPLDGATVRGSINVRLTGCATGPWQYTVDTTAVNTEFSCPYDLANDNALYDTTLLADGVHTITATGPTPPPLIARFTVANGAVTVPPAPPAPPGTPGWTGSAILSWTPPTTNSDGSALTDLAGYRIFYGASAANLSQTVTLANPGLRTYTLPGLTAGTWYAAMVSYNTSGAASVLSNTVSTTLTAPLPTCGAAPAVETRNQSCPMPLIGNWSQTNAWTSVPAPACWAPAWLPTDPPAGVCASPALLTAGPLSYADQGTASVPKMAAIGLIAAGLPCGPTVRLAGTVKYCQIQRSQTDLIVWPVDLTLAALWARAQ